MLYHLLTDAFSYLRIYYVSDVVTQNINYRRLFKCTFLFCLLICLCAARLCRDVTWCKFS